MSRYVIEPPDVGVLFVLSGASGVGKSTLIDGLMRVVPHVGFSVSATTRGPRHGEVDGKHYHFMTDEVFAQGLLDGAFLEHAEVYGRRYGTLGAPVRQALGEGRSILLDIDVQGAAQISASMSEAVKIFILPPDRETVHRRLRARDTDSDAVIARRMAAMDEQMAAVGAYDYLIVNDDLPTAVASLRGVVLAEMSRSSRRNTLVKRWASGGISGQ
jgi:guanylate kinase